MGQQDHHYQMLNKALIWGAALFLLTLGWFMPPGNTHYTFVEKESGQVRSIDTISATRCVAVKRVWDNGKLRDEPRESKDRVPVGIEVVNQAADKGKTLIAGAAAVIFVWAAVVLTLNRKRSLESRPLFPSFRLVLVIVLLGGPAYGWFILNIADVLPEFLGGTGVTKCS